MAVKPALEPGEIIAVIRRVFRENGREYIRYYVLAAFCLALIAATTAFSAWIVRDVVDEIFYRKRYELTAVICAAIAAAFLIRGGATYVQAVLMARVGNNLVARYQRRMFDHLMKLGLDFYNDKRSSQLISQINQNIGGIRDLLNMTVASVARDIVALIGLVAVMIIQDPLLSAIAIIIGPPLILSVNYLMRRLRRLAREAVEINSRVHGAMQEAAQGIAIVKAFTMESQLAARLSHLIASAEARANKISRVQERTTPIAESLAGIAIAGVIAYSSYRAAYSEVPPGSVFSFITALLLAYEPAKRLARTQVALERSLVHARMIYEILDIVPPEEEDKGKQDLKVNKGDIRLDKIQFRYSPDLPVIRGVSFHVPAGTTTALVGPSGAGKTTLIALLQRFYDPDSGKIMIDGQDITKYTKRSLRGSIAYVAQAPFLFEGTIADNIRYGNPAASDDQVRKAAKMAQCDEFIERLPNGLDTPVGEGGSNLSGGQRQRLSIARALVRDAPILLLDEATSALDNESEKKVQQALETVMQQRTTIVVAHRLSTVRRADNIIVLADGKLVEQGTHDQLKSRPNGIYARYHQLGVGGGLELLDDVDGDSTADQEDTLIGTRSSA